MRLVVNCEFDDILDSIDFNDLGEQISSRYSVSDIMKWYDDFDSVDILTMIGIISEHGYVCVKPDIPPSSEINERITQTISSTD